MKLTDERGWILNLPAGMYEVRVPPPPECTAMAHLRGEIAAGSPVFGVLSTRARDGRALESFATHLSESLIDVVREPFQVAGSDAAVRLHGRIDMGEGLTADGIERIDVVIAEAGSELIALTLRTRPLDPVGELVESILRSLELGSPAG